ncbi:peroxiredoxin family protein [Cohnella caldifontis]|uniref:peroxiredoxin family protein n=1 Tax=Cohnella caldifontis TaxID=3027471 RepID=UPI0023EE0A0B|nr:redoxin domain-containing protein [Cohnella sp. YIM B05605]
MSNIRLQSGMAAPLFAAADIHGHPVSLEDYRGRKVLLAFFRFSACALCNLRVRRFKERYPQWRSQGLEVIAVFESPLSHMKTYVGAQDVSFPLVADPGAALYDLFGVEVSAEKVQVTLADERTKGFVEEAASAGFPLTPEQGSNFHRIPAEFLLDERGIVRTAHYGRLLTDHLAFEEIDRFAAE